MVAPTSAAVVHEMDIIGRMDPYVLVTVGTMTQKTKVHKRGGRNPKWEDKLVFNCNSNDVIQFRLYDEDLIGDDYMGEVRVPVYEVLNNGGTLNNSYPFVSHNNSGILVVQMNTSSGGFISSNTAFNIPIASNVFGTQMIRGGPYSAAQVMLNQSNGLQANSPFTSSLPSPNQVAGGTITPAYLSNPNPHAISGTPQGFVNPSPIQGNQLQNFSQVQQTNFATNAENPYDSNTGKKKSKKGWLGILTG